MANHTNYKSYITGLKGFACVMVMIGQFLGVFAYADNMPINIHYFLAVRNSKQLYFRGYIISRVRKFLDTLQSRRI